jgi:hypothetical protein
MAHTFSWSPAPPEAGVLHYQIEKSSNGDDWEIVVQIPNRQDDESFDFERQQFRFALPGDEMPGDAYRIASVSDTAVGPYSYFYTPTPPPPAPIPMLEIGGPKSPYNHVVTTVGSVRRSNPSNDVKAAPPAGASPARSRSGAVVIGVVAAAAIIYMVSR